MKLWIVKLCTGSDHYDGNQDVLLGIFDSPEKAKEAFGSCPWYIGGSINWISSGEGFFADPNKAPYRLKRHKEPYWEELAYTIDIMGYVLNKTFIQTQDGG